MRRAARPQSKGAPVADFTSFPAPVNGINARDALAIMKPQDAVDMTNLFPTPTEVLLRSGYTRHSTFTGQQETVIIYNGLTATKVFGGVVNGGTRSIFDMTGAGAVGAAVVGGAGATIEALTNTRFDYEQFGTTGGAFMSLVNGADNPLEYDGTTWSVATLTHGSLTPANLFTLGVYAGRFWFGEKNTFNIYYLAAGAKSGALTQLNIGSLFKDGGSLNSIITLTDANNEVADYIGFLSTEGEIIAYTGINPAVAADWRLAAHFKVGRPVCRGNRTWCKWGVDALLVCADGVLPLRKALSADDRGRALAVSDRIQPLINYDFQFHGARFGWTIVVHPTNNKLLVNVPTNENIDARQWVMNTRHSAWTRFTGWVAFSMAVSRDQLYYGGNGYLAKADNVGVTSDNGASIFGEAKQAYNYLGVRGIIKMAQMLRPTFTMDGSVQISVSVDVDFGTQDMPALMTLSGISGDPWGGIWDVTWGGALTNQQPWITVQGVGECFAPRIKVVSMDSQFRWAASTLSYQKSIGVGL